MPTSVCNAISLIVEKAIELKPRTILDIGAGFGKYGFLLREYLDIACLRYKKDDWICRIDALECWKEYITPCHEYVYNNIYIASAVTKINQLENYDLILCCDMIEHLDKNISLPFIETLKTKCKTLFITLPLTKAWGEQGTMLGNPYEEHKCYWEKDELPDFKLHLFHNKNREYGFFIWSR